MSGKIELMIIGAQKAGTTSLNMYLQQHPNIATHHTIEFGMFADENSYKKGFQYHYNNAVDEMVKNDKRKSHFIAKRVGLMNNKALLAKLIEHNPRVKVLIVLRHPVYRAFSAFQYCRNKGMEPYNNFEDAVYKNDPSRFKGNTRIQKNCEYLLRSSYLQHLKNVYEIFPAEQVKVLLLEQMTINFKDQLNDIVEWIELPVFDFDISVRFNEREDTYSNAVAKLLSPGKTGKLINMIPAKWRLKIKSVLRNSNTKSSQKNKEKIQLEDSTKDYLIQYFKKDIHELASFTKLPLAEYWPDLF